MPLTTEKRPSGWWILGLEEDGQPLDCGPYTTKADAESDRRGMERFDRYEDRPGYVTTDARPASVPRRRKRNTPAPREQCRPRQLLAF